MYGISVLTTTLFFLLVMRTKVTFSVIISWFVHFYSIITEIINLIQLYVLYSDNLQIYTKQYPNSIIDAMFESVNRWPTEHKPVRNTQTISSLVDNSANVNRTRNNLSSVLWTVLFDFVPWSFCGHFYSFLELFGCVYSRIINPFLLTDLMMVCAD